MKKIAVITTKDAEFGFELAGVMQYVTDASKIRKLINKLLLEEIIGLIIIDERLIDENMALHIAEIEDKWDGIFFALPPPDFKEIEEDYARRIIRKAIGYQVKLNI